MKRPLTLLDLLDRAADAACLALVAVGLIALLYALATSF